MSTKQSKILSETVAPTPADQDEDSYSDIGDVDPIDDNHSLEPNDAN